MEIDDRECSECSSHGWRQVVQTDYPERRQERDRTVRTVYTCSSCGAEATHFEHQHEGTEVYSGAFR